MMSKPICRLEATTIKDSRRSHPCYLIPLCLLPAPSPAPRCCITSITFYYNDEVRKWPTAWGVRTVNLTCSENDLTAVSGRGSSRRGEFSSRAARVAAYIFVAWPPNPPGRVRPGWNLGAQVHAGGCPSSPAAQPPPPPCSAAALHGKRLGPPLTTTWRPQRSRMSGLYLAVGAGPFTWLRVPGRS